MRYLTFLVYFAVVWPFHANFGTFLNLPLTTYWPAGLGVQVKLKLLGNLQTMYRHNVMKYTLFMHFGALPSSPLTIPMRIPNSSFSNSRTLIFSSSSFFMILLCSFLSSEYVLASFMPGHFRSAAVSQVLLRRMRSYQILPHNISFHRSNDPIKVSPPTNQRCEFSNEVGVWFGIAPHKKWWAVSSAPTWCCSRLPFWRHPLNRLFSSWVYHTES